MIRAKGRAATGFRPKVQSRAESLSLESLDIRSGKSQNESRQGSRRIQFWTQTAESRQAFESGKFGHMVWKISK